MSNEYNRPGADPASVYSLLGLMVIPTHLLAEQDNFLSAVQNEDELGAVVRSHIYVESALVFLLEHLVVDKKYLGKLDLDYSQRVDLAIALGLKPEHAAPLHALGTIRNAFAHRLDAKLTKDRVDALYKQFSASDKKVLNAAFKRTSSQVPVAGAKSLRALTAKDQFALMAVALRSLILVAIGELPSVQP